MSRALWSLAVAAILLLLVKFFVADVYRVDSGSMRPTLFGGRDRADDPEETEHVLVLYGRDFRPQRFDLVVIRAPDGTTPLVKRVCGVPGDRDLMIRDGDLFVARQRLPPDAPRPAPIPVYDDRYLDPERFFEHRRDGSVRREGEAWVVDGGPAPGNLLQYHFPLRDDYLDRNHQRVPGVVEVNDAVLELEFRLDGPLAAQVLRFQLREERDLFEVLIAASGAGATLRLVRRDQRDPEASEEPAPALCLAEVPVVLAPERWWRLSFSNIDNTLRVRAPELGVDLLQEYAENAHWRAARAGGQKGFAPVGLGAEGGVARFRALRILRDIYYVDQGVFGTRNPDNPASRREPTPVSIGPDEYFLLGDNSAASTDSRHFGPLKASAIVGRPLAVVWPKPRWLHAVAPP